MLLISGLVSSIFKWICIQPPGKSNICTRPKTLQLCTHPHTKKFKKNIFQIQHQVQIFYKFLVSLSTKYFLGKQKNRLQMMSTSGKCQEVKSQLSGPHVAPDEVQFLVFLKPQLFSYTGQHQDIHVAVLSPPTTLNHTINRNLSEN